jgi:hypothetical protein
MAAMAQNGLPERHTPTSAADGQRPTSSVVLFVASTDNTSSVVLFVASTDNTSVQLRALDALNRHSGVIRARFAPNTTRLIQVDYRAQYTNVAELIETAKFYAGVGLRGIS